MVLNKGGNGINLTFLKNKKWTNVPLPWGTLDHLMGQVGPPKVILEYFPKEFMFEKNFKDFLNHALLFLLRKLDLNDMRSKN